MINGVSDSNVIDINMTFTEDKVDSVVNAGGAKTINMRLGAHYILAQNVAGKNELLKELVAIRKGDDLIIFHADGSKIVFANYYLLCAPSNDEDQEAQDSCSVTVAGKDGGEHTFTSDESGSNGPNATDISFIVYTQGSHSALENIVATSNEFDDLLSNTSTANSGSSFGSAMAGLLAGAAAAGGGAAAGGTATVVNTITGTIVLGPVVAGHGLQVQLYKEDGVTLLTTAKVDENGRFTGQIGDYAGVVIAKVVDTTAGADYVDEATGQNIDLADSSAFTLLSVIDASAGGTITVSITPLTTLAAQEAGVDINGSADASVASGVTLTKTLTAQKVNDANKGVAKAFGLGTDADVVTDTVVAVVDQSGSAAAGNTYGKVLAALSGVDDVTGSVADTITKLKAELSGSGDQLTLNTAGKQTLIDGASNAEAGNSAIASSGLAGDVVASVNAVSTTDIDAVVDTTAPTVSAAVSNAVDNVGGTRNLSISGEPTNDLSPQLVGTVSAVLNTGEQVNVYDGSTLLGHAIVTGTDWTYQDSRTLDSGATPSYTVKVSDAAGNESAASAAFTLTINIPTLTLSATADSNLAENAAYSAAAPTLSGGAIGAVTYTLEGADALDFTVSATGAVSMVARDFENAADSDTNNTYAYTLKATDADGNTATDAVIVTVTNVTESASLTLSVTADSNLAENVAYAATAPTLTGTAIGAVTYTLEGTDAADFTVNASTGAVSMIADRKSVG